MIPMALGVLPDQRTAWCGLTHLIALPIPAKARVTTSPAPLFMNPPIKVKIAMTDTPVTKTNFRPCTSATRPAKSRKHPAVSEYADETHCRSTSRMFSST